MSGRHSAEPQDPAIHVVSGNPTPAEIAAITAVLAGIEAERAAAAAVRKTPVAESAWSRSRRALRTPLTPGPGQWGHHHG